MADKSLWDNVKEGASGVKDMYSLGYKSLLPKDKEPEPEPLKASGYPPDYGIDKPTKKPSSRATDKAAKTEAFKDSVKKNKPKNVDKPSPGLEEDKTPSGGPLKRAKGGALGCGAAMRGYGAVRKK